MSSPDNNGWSEWQRHVLAELRRLSDAADRQSMRMSRMEIAVATLKVKAGFWGLLGGSIPVLIALGLAFLRN